MKLPEDKKERTKILVLIGIGAVILVGLIFKAPVIGILPVLESKKAKLAKIEQLKLDLTNARREIEQRKKDEIENLDILRKITEISEKYVLRPVLRNYKIPASEIVNPVAQKYNLKIEQFREVGISQEAAQTTFRAYSARVALFCSYSELVSLVREIEKSSPLIAVLNISIVAQSATPEKHQASFDVQIPVWAADPDMPTKLAQQLKDLTTAGSGPK